LTPKQEDFVQSGCATDRPAVISPGVFALDGRIGVWPASGYCRVKANKAFEAIAYTISADFYNANSVNGVKYGHIGIFYNAVDINNFDIAYFHVHGPDICFHNGQLLQGNIKTEGLIRKRCPNGNPPGALWYNVKVVVNGSKADVYRDEVFIESITNYFAHKASGGVLVLNGFNNLAYFRNVKIDKLR